MISFDFQRLAKRLQDARNLPVSDVSGGDVVGWEIERELAVQAALYLYDRSLRRGDLASAMGLLAVGVPVWARGDPRVRSAVDHAVALCEGKFGGYEKELLHAREGTYLLADEFADNLKLLPSRAGAFYGIVRLLMVPTALEYGCGHGSNIFALAKGDPDILWSGCDISAEQVALCSDQASRIGSRARFFVAAQGEVERHYGCVGLLDVLEHTLYPDRVLDDAERYLDDDGVMVVVLPHWHGTLKVQDPTALDYAAGAQAMPSHVNVTSLEEAVALITRRGEVLDARLIPGGGPGEGPEVLVAYRPLVREVEP